VSIPEPTRSTEECQTAIQRPVPSVARLALRSSPTSVSASVLSGRGGLHESPSSVERAKKTSRSVPVPPIFSVVNHVAIHVPLPSPAASVKGSPAVSEAALMLTKTGYDQVVPPSVEREPNMSTSSPAVSNRLYPDRQKARSVPEPSA